VCLILLILVFIWLQEPLSIGAVMTGLVGLAIMPTLVFFSDGFLRLRYDKESCTRQSPNT